MGIDLGGTSTRAELMDETGAVLGTGVADGANLRSAGGGIAGAADAVRLSAERALAAAQQDARDASMARYRRPEVVVVAASGAGPARHEEVAEAFRTALAGICRRVHVENDLAAAFRSASSGADGYLLLSGTGAVAGRYRGGVLEERADGLGWILGDTGSGLWIGWQGLRAVAADLDGRGPHTELTAVVVAALEVAAVTGDPCQDLVRRVDELAPAEMGALAPLVLAAAGTDEVAAGIAERAARALMTSLDAVIEAGGAGDGSGGSADGVPRPVRHEVVLAGGVLAHRTPVREAVVTELEGRGGWRIATAADPVVGALRIARDLADRDQPGRAGTS